MSYKLSYTAQEVDELLGKVKGGVCLPVVELNVVANANDVTALSAEEAAKMEALSCEPCILKIPIDLMGNILNICGAASAFVDEGGICSYSVSSSIGHVVVSNESDNGGWGAQFMTTLG